MIELAERVATLEAEVDALKRVAGKVDEIHAVLTQAKGAKWVLVNGVGFIVAIAGVLAAWHQIKQALHS